MVHLKFAIADELWSIELMNVPTNIVPKGLTSPRQPNFEREPPWEAPRPSLWTSSEGSLSKETYEDLELRAKLTQRRAVTRVSQDEGSVGMEATEWKEGCIHQIKSLAKSIT